MWIWKNFYFHTNFQISRYTRISLNHWEKNENAQNKIAKNVRSLTLNVWFYQTRTLLKLISILFSFENESDFIGVNQYGWRVLQFVRVYVRINFLNALIILCQSTSRNLRELKIHDNIYPNYEKYDNICNCLYFRVYQFTCNSVNNLRIQVYICMVCNLVCINKMKYSELLRIIN